jgi:hypothetical protein
MSLDRIARMAYLGNGSGFDESHNGNQDGWNQQLLDQLDIPDAWHAGNQKVTADLTENSHILMLEIKRVAHADCHNHDDDRRWNQ